MSSSHQHVTDPAGIPELHSSAKKGVEMGADAVKAVTGVRRLIFCMAQLIYSVFILVTAAWTTPLLRTRIGIMALVVDAPVGFLSLLMISGMYRDWPSNDLIALWLLALLCLQGWHLVPRAWRFFFPSGEHTHRHELGVPNRLFFSLWELVLRRWGMTRMRISLLCEPLLLLAVAFVIWRLEAAFGGTNSGVAQLVLLSAIGVFLQSADMIIKERWHMQLLKDQEAEQTALAEALAQHPSASTGREAEGVAELASLNGRGF